METPTHHSKRILIVEDDHVVSRDIEGILGKRGFTVAGVASTREEALEKATASPPDLALVNIRLETVDDGADLAIQLKQRWGVPVIFVTGYSEASVFEKASRAEPVGFVRKPFSEAELVATITAALNHNVSQDLLLERIEDLKSMSGDIEQAVIASDLTGEVVFLNHAAETLLCVSADQAEGQPLHSLLKFTVADDAVATPLSEKANKYSSLIAADGTEKTVEERTAPIRTDAGEVIGLVTLLADYAEAAEDLSAPSKPPPGRAKAISKIAQISKDPGFRSLLARQAPLKSASAPEPSANEPKQALADAAGPIFSSVGSPLVDDLGDPLIKINENGKIEYANADATEVFGNGTNLNGLSFWDRFTGAEFDQYRDAFRQALDPETRHQFEFHDSSRGRWFDVRTYHSGGGVLALFSNITAKKLEASEALRQQRLEGLGLLARGFAHDFNNQLTTITGNISLAREKLADDPSLHDMLSEAQAASTKATGLVQQLMTFARGGKPVRKGTRVSDLIRRVLTEHRIQHPAIRYQFQGAENELVANLDPAQIGRLLENLIGNSALAMIDGGVLIVRSARISSEDVARIKPTHHPVAEDHVLIEVIDTGHGMSEDALGRVFEPYFTTRKEDNATGIGLTVCESIARAHGGFVQLQSKENKGTIATVCLPLGLDSETVDRFYDSVETDRAGSTLAEPAGYRGNFDNGNNLLVGTRILILEDDAPIRRLMAATLRRAGHEVVETKEGNETVAAYKAAMEGDAKFHLLICDLTIENGMGGVDTMKQLVELDPEILAIVSSGYSDAPAMANPDSFGFKAVLPKPYAPSELRAAVHRILAANHIIA